MDHERLLRADLPETVQTYTRRDAMLYALGVGYGADPMDADQLRFVYEEGLLAAPTFGVVLGHPVMDYEGFRLDRARLIHGEQHHVLHRPIPPEGTVVGKTTINDILDKGPGRGAVIDQTRKLYDQATGDHLATFNHLTFCVGEGGWGGPNRPSPPAPAVPGRAPDAELDMPTLPQAALIYRLSGDYNSLHADPRTAARVGYPAPILHGLATYGLAAHAIIKAFGGYDPQSLTAMGLRFSSPVFPGETVRVRMWRDDKAVTFRATVEARGAAVLQNGHAALA